MSDFPIVYDAPLFRPPSEGNSLILQATLGCSWNHCSFCEMYTSKSFRPRAHDDIVADMDAVASRYQGVDKIFLADGNALVLSTRRLLALLQAIRDRFGSLKRVSAYALPSDILRKSEAELAALCAAGLTMLYIGVESGDDEVLRRVNKGETSTTTRDCLLRAGAAGIQRSVMVLNGLGGQALSEQHAANTAAILNAGGCEYLSTLVVSFPVGQKRFLDAWGTDCAWTELTQIELFEEEYRLLDALTLHDTEFRSNHASNYLVLKGRLGQDKERLLAQLRQAIAQPGSVSLRPEWARGL